MTLAQSLPLLAVAAALGAATVGAHAQALKLDHITPPTHVWHQVSEKIATDLDKASGGKMKIAVSPLQKLGNEAQMINLMQAGAQQFGVFTVGGLSNREESFLGWSLPYVFKDVAHASRAAGTPAAKEMLKRLDAHGLVGLGYAFAGMRHVLSLQPVCVGQGPGQQEDPLVPEPDLQRLVECQRRRAARRCRCPRWRRR